MGYGKHTWVGVRPTGDETVRFEGWETWGWRDDRLARSVGSAGLLKAGLTLGAPVLKVSGRSKDARHGMSIASLLPTRCRSNGRQRLGFRALQLQVTGWQTLERFKCGLECGEQTLAGAGADRSRAAWECRFSGGEWPVRRHQQQRRSDAQQRRSKQYGFTEGGGVVFDGLQLSEAWRTIDY